MEVEKVKLGELAVERMVKWWESGFWDGEVKEVERGDRKREEDGEMWRR